MNKLTFWLFKKEVCVSEPLRHASAQLSVPCTCMSQTHLVPGFGYWAGCCVNSDLAGRDVADEA